MPLKLSVVIVTRNRLPILQQCLRSIAVQTGQPPELIIVDNASTDGTSDWIRANLPAVRLLSQTDNLGAAGGRNAGIFAATGDVCFSMDDDAQLLDTNAFTTCLAYFERNPKLAALATRIVDQQGKVVKKLIPRRDREDIARDSEAANFSGTGFAVRRDIFMQLGGFWDKLNPYFGEEPDYCYRLMESGWQIISTPSINVRHEETPRERPAARRLYCGTRNAPWLAVRNLPWSAAFSLTVLSLGYFFLVGLRHRQLGSYFKAVWDCAAGMPEALKMRKPISMETARRVRRLSGLYFY